jgi:purine-binding chemotaxis protein CheW
MDDMVAPNGSPAPLQTSREPASIREFLAIVLAGEAYGVPLGLIREIVSPPPITVVPRAPQHVLGVCSVRGQLVTVVDLRSRLRLELAPLTNKTRILLTECAGEVVGLYVDEVHHVVRLAEHEIELATQVFGGDFSEYVVGVGRPPGELLVLLDLASLIPS